MNDLKEASRKHGISAKLQESGRYITWCDCGFTTTGASWKEIGRAEDEHLTEQLDAFLASLSATEKEAFEKRYGELLEEPSKVFQDAGGCNCDVDYHCFNIDCHERYQQELRYWSGRAISVPHDHSACDTSCFEKYGQ